MSWGPLRPGGPREQKAFLDVVTDGLVYSTQDPSEGAMKCPPLCWMEHFA
jgi:hypothetical protein